MNVKDMLHRRVDRKFADTPVYKLPSWLLDGVLRQYLINSNK